jgi:hypothetical protein
MELNFLASASLLYSQNSLRAFHLCFCSSFVACCFFTFSDAYHCRCRDIKEKKEIEKKEEQLYITSQ